MRCWESIRQGICIFRLANVYDRKLQQKYFFQGQTFLEYHTDAQAEVILHYAVGEEEFKEEEMKEVYAGIYASRFMLFFGDSLQYYIEERNGEQTRDVTESAQITRQDVLLRRAGKRQL